MAWSLALSGLLCFGGADTALRASKTPWLEELATAQTEARRTGKLIFAVLH
jgi:hypothetical protein